MSIGKVTSQKIKLDEVDYVWGYERIKRLDGRPSGRIERMNLFIIRSIRYIR
jgi:hypothetical protein